MKLRNNLKQIKISIIVFAIVLFIVFISFIDILKHGFYCDVIPIENIYAEDFLEYVDLGQETFEQIFSPVRKHFAGFEINLINEENNLNGYLLLTVFDENRKQIDQKSISLRDIKSQVWFPVEMNKELREGYIYTLKIEAFDFEEAPKLQVVDEDYLPSENIEGNLLLGYAYSESTFSISEKILISIFLIDFLIYIIGKELKIINLQYKLISAFIFMVAVLSWNYMYNFMDNNNKNFQYFQSDSETLVTGVIKAKHNQIYSSQKYGLGRYSDILGDYYNYDVEFVTDENWDHGYSRTDSVLLLPYSTYSKKVAQPGNYVKFSNDSIFRIDNVDISNTYMYIRLISDRALSYRKYGSLSNVVFYDSSMQPLENGILSDYCSQYGLQGKFFLFLDGFCEPNHVRENLYLICSVLTATVFTSISFLIAYKYNKLMAICFYITFWLSPWIVNFARNLYWVEFTWFIPMLAGLICSFKIENSKYRIYSYILMFVSITIKCLCGYEYISTIMMSGFVFLFSDFVYALQLKDKSKAKLVFRTSFILGVFALLGFLVALCIHATVFGDGGILQRIKMIFELIAEKRIKSNGMQSWGDKDMLLSFNASIWEVFCTYFHFDTEIITGISGNFFTILCSIPLCIWKTNRKENEWSDIALYIICFFASVSWFVLAKPHSYIHTHMNYVLWYFGFIQICFYIICKQILYIVKKDEVGEKNNHDIL